MIFRNARVISPANSLDEVIDIEVKNGYITRISKNIEGENIDCEGKIIIPGLVDLHCHLREPGYEYKETIKSGIESALNGGFTAICPMANTNPTIDNSDTLKFVIDKATNLGQNSLEFCPICSVTKNLEGKELTEIKTLKKNGAVAFSDDGKPLNDIKVLKEALKTNELIISHPEDEAQCVEREINVYREVGGKLHFAHISTKKALDLIAKAKSEGLKITCETAPHYFTFTKEDVTENGRFKMNPPLRTKEDLKAIIKGLQDGTIDCIATDHAPHSMKEKTKPFKDSPMGIVGFETALGASLNLVEQGFISFNRLIELTSINPAKILNLTNQGQISVGKKANFIVINPNEEYTIKASEFKSKCKISPFEGLKFKGRLIKTVANGNIINIGDINANN